MTTIRHEGSWGKYDNLVNPFQSSQEFVSNAGTRGTATRPGLFLIPLRPLGTAKLLSLPRGTTDS